MKALLIGTILAWGAVVLGADIQVMIEPVTNGLLVTEASARLASPPRGVDLTSVFPHPDTSLPMTVTGNNIVHLSDDASQEAHACARTNAFRVDFFACIKNVSTNTLNFYDERNSLGFDRLTLVCYGWQEIWITKQPGIWYRNFPSWTSVRPGGSFRIPVAFDESLWDGVARAKQAKHITGIRVFYDQLGAPTNAFGASDAHWQGSAFSPLYDIGLILPRRGFKSAEQKRIEKESNKSAHGTR